MNHLVSQCLDVIESETGSGLRFDQSFRAVDVVLAHLGQADIANKLWGLVGDSGRMVALSELLGILIWTTSDNGHEVMLTLNQWLRDAESEAKCWIALNGEYLVLGSAIEARNVLSVVASKFPSLVGDCQMHIDQWSKNGSSS